MEKTRPSHLPALDGLEDALARYPQMSRKAVCDALGITRTTLFNWLAGDTPKAHHIEILHDFIHGRLLPVEIERDVWEFRPPPPTGTTQQEFKALHRALGELADGKAQLLVGPDVVAILRNSTELDLTSDIRPINDGAVDANTYRRPGEQMKLAALRWFSDDQEIADAVARVRGVSRSELIRQLVRREGERVLKKAD